MLLSNPLVRLVEDDTLVTSPPAVRQFINGRGANSLLFPLI